MAIIHLEFAPEDIRTFFAEIRQSQKEAKETMREAMNSMNPTAGEKVVRVEGLAELNNLIKDELSMAKAFLKPDVMDAIKRALIKAASESTNKCNVDQLNKEATSSKEEEEEWL